MGAAALAVSVLAPDLTQQAVGQVRHVAQAVELYAESTDPVAGPALPTVRLGELGPEALLDVCDGSFPELEQYRVEATLQPVYAAHNNCGGDIILAWQVGTNVTIQQHDGSTATYVVTDSRDVGKHGSTTGDLLGLDGTLLVQSCYWGRDTMRFVALNPVTSS
ncbi:hypothetical protein C5B85_18220 [Pseudoclavibacter sp. AY1F1]|nr:hypothetical protein C5B85_18220 [Pseudoclavibacter sp. AY1F1]